MKILKFNNGGRPLLNDDIVALQANDETRSEAWLRGLQVGAVVLEGCALTLVSGTTYNLSAGVAFIDGKVVEVAAALALNLTSPQYIVLNPDNDDDFRLHENGDTLVSASTRSTSIVGTLPTLTEHITLTAGVQPSTLKQALDNATLPIGSIMMTDSVVSFNVGTGLGSGAWLGFALCDGQNGTPNLKGRFVVGFDNADADYNAIGDTGGAKTVALTIAEMPAHNHSIVLTENDAGNLIATGGTGSGGTQNTSTQGSGTAHENRPPYYTLAYVKKIA